MFLSLVLLLQATPDIRTQSIPVPRDVSEALDAYRATTESVCTPLNESGPEEARKRILEQSILEQSSQYDRDLAAMRSYYKQDFHPRGPFYVKAAPPICRTPEDFKSREDKLRSALERLTRSLVAHGVLSHDNTPGGRLNPAG